VIRFRLIRHSAIRGHCSLQGRRDPSRLGPPPLRRGALHFAQRSSQISIAGSSPKCHAATASNAAGSRMSRVSPWDATVRIQSLCNKMVRRTRKVLPFVVKLRANAFVSPRGGRSDFQPRWTASETG
jgi:hypothetical protein